MKSKSAIILLLIMLLPLLITACSPVEAPTITENGAELIPEQPAAPAEEPAAITPIIRTELEDAYAAFDSGSAIFLDVRNAEEFDEQRIPGSINIPLLELPGRLGELDPENRYITLCT